MRHKILLFLLVLVLISSCNIKENCKTGVCEDGFEYKQFELVNGECKQIMYLVDPCLDHYKECSNDSDCGIGGCSAQVCGKKGEIEKLITTCKFRSEYQCLKQSSCSCINNKCQWNQNKEYLGCLDKIRV